ncbi:MAG: hypothetical protein RJB66_1847 [Pseudomonadota bacterium]|jgi:chemotaxis protein MotB
MIHPRFNRRYRSQNASKVKDVLTLLETTTSSQKATADAPSPIENPLVVLRRIANTEEAESDSIWLISYADLMTLLFGFFVMLMTFSKIDQENFEKARKETTRFFGGEYKLPMQKLQSDLAKEVHQQQLAEQVHFELDNRGLSVTFRGALFFDSGSAELRPEAEALTQKILPVIKNLGPDIKIIVEGHTDDSPIYDERFPSNWELSSYRATRVLRLLQTLGVPKTQLRAIGFGDSMPAFPNRDEKGHVIAENQSQNRRVVLRIIRSTDN